MSYAPNYTPETSFADDEYNNVAGRSLVKTERVDSEFASVSASINAINTNLKSLQRDDGKLADSLVEPYALSEQTRALIAVAGCTPRGTWKPGEDYAYKDVIQRNNIAQMCIQAHNSGSTFTQSFWLPISGDGTSAANAAAAAESAADAMNSKTDAEIAKSAAEDAATAAALSESNASTSETNAENSASSAATSEESAINSAEEAANSATSASASAATATSAANSASTLFNNFNTQYLALLSLGKGFSNLKVHTLNATWTVPAGVTKAKVTVVAGAGGLTTGNPSSFGSLLSATGGGAQRIGNYAYTSNNDIAFNTPGVGVGGDINLSGNPGADSVCVNLAGSLQTRIASAAGGMTALGLGRGSNVEASAAVNANGRLVARGGAGGGVAIAMLDLTPGDTHGLTIGLGGGNGASDGLIIIEY